MHYELDIFVCTPFYNRPQTNRKKLLLFPFFNISIATAMENNYHDSYCTEERGKQNQDCF
ncbi:hypothetical protein SAMN05660493_00304 [Epilithonimonas bovis DSM 19482]|uniref:Uncharacterized protein n=1 Tax=Epilithonimonas bovis DSM 19482 TaxID=1121284 RepID=A0A1U7PUM8_9FLAO|nr:hypothetical protein SAMN05660493_00304 [Epilithonimonas bovis DSM 19482]